MISRFLAAFILSIFTIAAFCSEAAAAPALTGTINVVQITDNDSDGLLDPGEILRYTATITNNEPAPVTNIRLGIHGYGLTLVPGTIQSTFGEVSSSVNLGSLFTIINGSLAAGTTGTIVYQTRMPAPEGFQPPADSCSAGSIYSGDEFVGSLVAPVGNPIGFGACLLDADFDNDEIVDREDLCVNVPHSSAKLDIPLQTSGDPLVSAVHTLNLLRRGPIESIEAAVTLDHDWVGDVVIKLTHVPTGKTVKLLDQPGKPPNDGSSFGCSEDDIRATFVGSSTGVFQSAEDQCQNPNPAVIGTFNSFEDLDQFIGEDMSGAWQLTVEDHFPSADGGRLIQWCLNLTSKTDLSVEILGPSVAPTGRQFQQRLKVTNNGPGDLVDLQLQAELDRGAIAQSARLLGLPVGAGAFSAADTQFFKSFVGPLDIGASKEIEIDLLPPSTNPFVELLVAAPLDLVGSYEAVSVPSAVAPAPTEAGVSGELVEPALTPTTCTLINPASVTGKIALFNHSQLSFQGCFDATAIAGKVVDAGGLAVVFKSAFLARSDELTLTPLANPGANPLPIPVIGISNAVYDKLKSAASTPVITLRANQLKPTWNARTELSTTQPYMQSSSFARVLKVTEIQGDTDLDGFGDVSEGCPADASKSSPGACGCGLSDADVDGDSVADCKDFCLGDSTKSSPGICGCGISDVDANSNGTADCKSGTEIKGRYQEIQKLLKGVKPVALTGNKKKDKARKDALKARVARIKTLLTEIEAIIKAPVQPITLKNSKLNLKSESSKTHKSIRSALKTAAATFAVNKQTATSKLKKFLSALAV